MTELLGLLHERIKTRGPVTFAEYQNLALYHPEHGYYARGLPRTGRRGHFLTSPEVTPAFGGLWAKAFQSMWEGCGRPHQFDIVEIGPAEAGFAAAVLAASRGQFAEALSYRLIEPIPALVDRQMERLAMFDNVVWSSSLSEVSQVPAGCVFANEVLDNLAVHLVEQTGDALVELFVGLRDGRLVLEPGPPSDPALVRYVEDLGVDLPKGHRIEAGLEAVSVAREAAGVIAGGAAMFVDYGAEVSELVGRPAGTLVAYSEAGVDDLILDRPGEKDLTSHVNWTAVAAALIEAGAEVTGPRPQATVLKELGVGDYERSLKLEYGAAVAEGRGADAVRALSQRHALAILTDGSGLGGLEVLVGARGVARPRFIQD